MPDGSRRIFGGTIMKTLIIPLILVLMSAATVSSARNRSSQTQFTSEFTYHQADGKSVTITGTADEIRNARDALRESCGAFSSREQVQTLLNDATTPHSVVGSDKPETSDASVIGRYKDMMKDKEAALNEWIEIYTKIFKRPFNGAECPASYL